MRAKLGTYAQNWRMMALVISDSDKKKRKGAPTLEADKQLIPDEPSQFFSPDGWPEDKRKLEMGQALSPTNSLEPQLPKPLGSAQPAENLVDDDTLDLVIATDDVQGASANQKWSQKEQQTRVISGVRSKVSASTVNLSAPSHLKPPPLPKRSRRVTTPVERTIVRDRNTPSVDADLPPLPSALYDNSVDQKHHGKRRQTFVGLPNILDSSMLENVDELKEAITSPPPGGGGQGTASGVESELSVAGRILRQNPSSYRTTIRRFPAAESKVNEPSRRFEDPISVDSFSLDMSPVTLQESSRRRGSPAEVETTTDLKAGEWPLQKGGAQNLSREVFGLSGESHPKGAAFAPQGSHVVIPKMANVPRFASFTHTNDPIRTLPIPAPIRQTPATKRPQLKYVFTLFVVVGAIGALILAYILGRESEKEKVGLLKTSKASPETATTKLTSVSIPTQSKHGSPSKSPPDFVPTCSQEGRPKLAAEDILVTPGLSVTSKETEEKTFYALSYVTRSGRYATSILFDQNFLNLSERQTKISGNGNIRRVFASFLPDGSLEKTEVESDDKRSLSPFSRVVGSPMWMGVHHDTLVYGTNNLDRDVFTRVAGTENGSGGLDVLRTFLIDAERFAYVYRRRGVIGYGLAGKEVSPVEVTQGLAAEVGVPTVAGNRDDVAVVWADRAHETDPYTLRMVLVGGPKRSVPIDLPVPRGGLGYSMTSPTLFPLAQRSFLLLWTEGDRSEQNHEVRGGVVNSEGKWLGDIFSLSSPSMNAGGPQVSGDSRGHLLASFFSVNKEGSISAFVVPLLCGEK